MDSESDLDLRSDLRLDLRADSNSEGGMMMCHFQRLVGPRSTRCHAYYKLSNSNIDDNKNNVIIVFFITHWDAIVKSIAK